MDCCRVNGLELYAYHGVFTEEKKLGQRFILNIELEVDLQKAGLTDHLTTAIHYGEVAQKAATLFTEKSYDLIERVAEVVAVGLLKSFSIASAVRVEVIKPGAPIALAPATVSVCVNRKRHDALIGLGSNQGNREEMIQKALEQIADDYTEIISVAPVIHSEPWGVVEQPSFLNTVCHIRTFYEPLSLLEHLQAIENNLGRVRHQHWGPRTIDLDILYFDQYILHSQRLNLPHPYLRERTFVLEPLAECAPHWRDPLDGKTMRELWREYQEKEQQE